MTIIRSAPTLAAWRSDILTIRCDCGRTWTHEVAALRRNMPPISIEHLVEALTSPCRERPCRAVLVYPEDDGVSEAG